MESWRCSPLWCGCLTFRWACLAGLGQCCIGARAATSPSPFVWLILYPSYTHHGGSTPIFSLAQTLTSLSLGQSRRICSIRSIYLFICQPHLREDALYSLPPDFLAWQYNNLYNQHSEIRSCILPSLGRLLRRWAEEEQELRTESENGFEGAASQITQTIQFPKRLLNRHECQMSQKTAASIRRKLPSSFKKEKEKGDILFQLAAKKPQQIMCGRFIIELLSVFLLLIPRTFDLSVKRRG